MNCVLFSINIKILSHSSDGLEQKLASVFFHCIRIRFPERERERGERRREGERERERRERERRERERGERERGEEEGE